MPTDHSYRVTFPVSISDRVDALNATERAYKALVDRPDLLSVAYGKEVPNPDTDKVRKLLVKQAEWLTFAVSIAAIAEGTTDVPETDHVLGHLTETWAAHLRTWRKKTGPNSISA